MLGCKNVFCPVKYNPKKKPCKDCKFNKAKDLDDNDAINFFKDLFDMK